MAEFLAGASKQREAVLNPHLTLMQEPQAHCILPHAHKPSGAINGVQDPMEALRAPLGRPAVYKFQHLFLCAAMRFPFYNWPRQRHAWPKFVLLLA